MYDGNLGEIDFGSSSRGFELARVRLIGSRLYLCIFSCVAVFDRAASSPKTFMILLFMFNYWTGALRITNCNSCCKRWYFTFNDAECFAPLPIDGVVSMATRGNKDLHRVRHIEGHCNKGARGILDRQLPWIWKR